MIAKEFTAKTSEEAINEGLRQMGCTISDVKVEVLEEGSKGLLGIFGNRPAKVRLTMLSDEDSGDSMSDLLSSLSLDEKPAPKKQRKPEVKIEKKAETPKKTEAPKKAAAPKDAAPQKAYAPMQQRVSIETPTQPPVLHDANTPAGRAQQFLMEVTRLMNVPVQVYVDVQDDGSLYVRLIGDTLGILIGRRGETLDALQYLTSLQVNKGQDSYLRVTLDTEDYRARREDSLRRLANRMAQKAVKTGRRVSIEPMNPYERRVLHAALQGHPDVTTHSEGDEPNRHVVIVLNNGMDRGNAFSHDDDKRRPPRKRGSRGRGRAPRRVDDAAPAQGSTASEDAKTLDFLSGVLDNTQCGPDGDAPTKNTPTSEDAKTLDFLSGVLDNTQCGPDGESE